MSALNPIDAAEAKHRLLLKTMPWNREGLSA